MIYDLIYADPPWQYRNRKSRGAAKNHYETLSIDELKELRVHGCTVNEIAAEDAVLWLWMTAPMLPEQLEVPPAWGFEYSGFCVTWVKTNKDGSLFKGPGNTTRSNAEFLGLFTRGSGLVAEIDVPTVFVSQRKRHSQKPDEIRDTLAQAYPDARKIELFAREPHDGWNVWGDEIESDWE
jgi:site-specific DNA-methyltransferase (adenine-specific)